MTSSAESLAAILAQEQRGFRRILFTGVATLLLLVLMSGALGVYYYFASQSLERALARNAFETRRAFDQQNNRIANQQVALSVAYEEMRQTQNVVLTEAMIGAGRQAAQAYLNRGATLSLVNESLMRQAARSEEPKGSPAEKALFAGIVALNQFTAQGETISATGPLPAHLVAAQQAFELVAASSDPALAPVAHAGLAQIYFQIAQSPRSNYKPADCQRMDDEIAKSTTGAAAPGPQPLYWQATCQRKLGHPAAALALFARSANGVPEQSISGADPDGTELRLAQNAFHGMGTTLIALGETAASDPNLTEAMRIANQRCTSSTAPPASLSSPQMRLAVACLERVIAIRRELRNTENDVAGTRENLGFAYLRANDFRDAYLNAVAVNSVALSSWNELVRALSAKHIAQAAHDDSERREAFAAQGDAQRNISFLTVGSFNVCEIQALLNPDLFAEAQKIIKSAHPRDDVTCHPR